MTTRPGTCALAQCIHRKLATSAPTPARLVEAHRRSQALVARCGLPVPADLPPRCHLDALDDPELRSAAWQAIDAAHERGLLRRSDWASVSVAVQFGGRPAATAAVLTYGVS